MQRQKTCNRFKVMHAKVQRLRSDLLLEAVFTRAMPNANYHEENAGMLTPPTLHVSNHKHDKLITYKIHLTPTTQTDKPYCIVAPLFLDGPESTLPVFAYCCCAAHNTASLFQLNTAALVLPAPLRAPSLSLKPGFHYLLRISKWEKRSWENIVAIGEKGRNIKQISFNPWDPQVLVLLLIHIPQ